jgi:hypothetical protein
MKRVITIKLGSSFSLPIIVLASDDSDVDNLLIENISSQIRTDNDDFAEDLVVELSPTTEGTVIVSSPDTSEWPLENLYLDVRYVINDVIKFTDTIVIKVVKQQTIPLIGD